MLSRIAESLYWMGRYIERAENTARLLDVNYYAIVEAPVVPGVKGIVSEQWAPLLAMAGDEEGFRHYYERADGRTVPEWLAFDARNPGSIRSSLARARENARALRERISSEMWEAINKAYLELCFDTEGVLERDGLHDYCIAAREASHLFFGIAHATLPRDLGWSFLTAGQLLERADNVLRFLQLRYRAYRGQEPVARGLENHRGMALLKSVSAYEAYRKRYYAALEPGRIADFLLLDPAFPRSLRYSVKRLHQELERIAQRNPERDDGLLRHAGWLAARLEYTASVKAIIEEENPSLSALLESVGELSDLITATYFSRGEELAQGGEHGQAQG